MPAHVDPDLRSRLDGDPRAQLEAIVLAEGELEELEGSLPGDVVVRHRYRLVRGLAVSARADVMRRVADLPTVKSIEPVRIVQAR